MSRIIYIALAALLLPWQTAAETNVIASTSDLAWFAKQIGGELVTVEAVASPTADLHFVEVRPSYIVKVSRAKLALKVGLDLDMWMDRLVDASRNGSLQVVDCSKYIEPLEVPSFKADARYGDLHQYGNPHYWLGPQNVEAITLAIVEGLTSVDPDNALRFAENRTRLLTSIAKGLDSLKAKVERLRGLEVIAYHNSWPYFCEYVGLTTAGFVEPYPGVPPSPSHIKELSDLMVSRLVRVIVMEPYFDRRVPEKIASSAGATVVTLYPSIGGRDRTEGYLEWFEGNLDALLEELK